MAESLTVADAAQRLLELLTLLGTRPSWTAPELAGRLGVTTRTVRADIARLRALDYPVHGTRGGHGGYRLGAGGRLPPLLLDDEEAVAVAVGLRAGTGIGGLAESSTRALTKLEQVLPARLRSSVDALGSTIERAPENLDTDAPDPVVPAEQLRTVAAAIAERELLRFSYALPPDAPDAPAGPPDGTRAPHPPGLPLLVEPCRLFHWQRRWYLVGRDVDRDKWDAYRLDLLELRMRTGRRVERPAEVPGGDVVAFLMRTVAITGWTVRARLRVAAPASAVLERIHHAVGVVEPLGDDACVLVTGADSLDTVAAYVGMLRMDFTVESPPELVPLLVETAQRYLRAASGTGPADPG